MRHRAQQPTEVTLRAVITRADGTVEDLGQIGGEYRNPLRRTWWRLIGQPAAERRIRRANDRARHTAGS